MQIDFERKLDAAWEMDRRRGALRRCHLAIAGVIAVLAIAVVPVTLWLLKATTSERCTTGKDCRSGACIRIVTAVPVREEIRLDGKVCTASCASDLDCPETMHCGGRTPSSGPQRALDVPYDLACLPKGY